MIELVLSILSIIVAGGSALITFFIWKAASVEVDYLKRQISYNSVIEIRKGLDEINNKIAEWNVDFPMTDGKIRFKDHDDKKKATIVIHTANLLFYSILQEGAFDSEFKEFITKGLAKSMMAAAKSDDVAKTIVDSLLAIEPKDKALRKFCDLLESTNAND